MTQVDRKSEIAMLKDPKRWPLWPALPIKNSDGRTAWVTADYPLIVLKEHPTMRGILLQLACEDGMPVPGATELHHAGDDERRVYEEQVMARYIDADGLLDAGWRID